jgi:UDP-N-acetylglucosamine 2-epimerase (non-hydrolysing)
MKKIGILLGTRPEAIKLLPVYLEMSLSGSLKPLLISTGQHQEMLKQIFDVFEIQPDIDLKLMTANQTLASLTAKLCLGLQDLFDAEKPDMILVQGDTTSAFIGSLIAFYNKIPVAHIEAGLRTYNKFSPFPEEINRKLISCVADYNFAPTEKAKLALEKEKAENIYVVGNTVVDSLLFCLEKIKIKKQDYITKFSFLKNYNKIVLITGHRRESFGQGFQNICESILQLSSSFPDMLFVYPVHLNPNVREVVYKMLKDIPNIRMIEPLPYDEMLFLMNNAHIILTDSGGIQEEAPTLNVPVLIMRDTTERMEGVEAGCSRLVGTEVNVIVSNFTELVQNVELYNQMSAVPNPYGDGTASKKIVTTIENIYV